MPVSFAFVYASPLHSVIDMEQCYHKSSPMWYGERNQEQRTKVSFGRTIMQVLELQRLAKRHISGRSNVEQ